MKYFSMFSGIGGFELGIQNVYRNKNRGSQKDTKENAEKREGLESEKRQEVGTEEGQVGQHIDDSQRGCEPTCVGYSEIDKYAIQVYEHHFKGHKNYGDARNILTEELPDFDLLVGGFPCQAFSVSGKRKGFDDTRGTLFFEIARILRDKRPRRFLLENVKGLLSHESGKTFQTILKVLTDIGYSVEWQVLNSKDFGVPQNRERVFIVGHLRERSGGKVFPVGESNTVASKKGCIVNTLPVNYYKGPAASRPMIAVPVLTPDIEEKRQNGRRFKEDGDPAFTLTAQDKHGVYDGYRIRRLTPTECERLQGFPDGWTEGISDTQRYKCLGNAVTVNVIEAIITKMVI